MGLFWRKKKEEKPEELKPFFPDDMLDELKEHSNSLRQITLETCELANDVSASLKDELFEVKQQLRELTNIISDGLIITNEYFDIVDVSKAAEKIFKQSKSNLLDHRITDIMPYEYGAEFQTILEKQTELTLNKPFDILEGAKGLTSDGKEIDIELTISQVSHDGLPCFYIIIRDITKRIEREKELAKKTKIVEVINSCAKNLLGQNWRETTGESLKLLGETINANRAFIYEFNGDRAEAQFEWHSATATKKLDTFHEIDWSNLGCMRVMEILKDRPVTINYETEDDLHIKALLAVFDAKSIGLFPIVVEDVLWGYFSFHYERDVKWTVGEVQALSTASSIFSEAIKRSRKNKDINVLRRAINSLSDSVIISDKNGHILFANEAFCEYTGYSYDELSGVIYWSILGDETYEKISSSTKKGESWEGIVTYKDKNKNYLRDYLIVVPVKNGDPNSPSLYLMIKKMHIPEETWYGIEKRLHIAEKIKQEMEGLKPDWSSSERRSGSDRRSK